VFNAWGTSSFQSVWYWVLSVLVWSFVTHRTLGVPYDMILRARRLPEVGARVDALAHIHAARVAGLYRATGIWLAVAGGFALAVLYGVGFVEGVELGQAAFLLAFPLAAIAYSTVTLALAVQARDFRGPALVRVLARRRFWHQLIAVLALFAALAAAGARHPLFFHG
jgi:hypothetical protein